MNSVQGEQKVHEYASLGGQSDNTLILRGIKFLVKWVGERSSWPFREWQYSNPNKVHITNDIDIIL